MSITVTQYPAAREYYAKNTVPKFVIESNVYLHIIIKRWTGWDYENFDWLDADTFFEGGYVPDFDGRITIDFSDCYAAHVKTLFPANNTQSQTGFYTYFVAKIIDDQGTIVGTYNWFVCNATLKSSTSFQQWSQQNFLTNQPIEKTTNYEAPEWLTWLDLSGASTLVARFYPKTGGHLDAQVCTFASEGCYSANVSYRHIIGLANVLSSSLKGYYDLILYDTKSEEVCRQRYIYEERSGLEKYYCFVNALGGIDTLICQGDNVLQPETTHNIGRFNNSYRALDDTAEIRQWTQNTGMMPTLYRNWIYELLTAKQGAEKYDPAAQDYYEIVVNSSEIAMGDHGQLSSATFGYILNDPVNVMRDTERAVDRSLHQSVADEAEEMDDLTQQVTLAMSPAAGGGSGYETEEVQIQATKLYVEWLLNGTPTGDYVYYNFEGKPSGRFMPGTDEMPVIITKNAATPIQFTTEDPAVAAIVIKYYPITIQSV